MLADPLVLNLSPETPVAPVAPVLPVTPVEPVGPSIPSKFTLYKLLVNDPLTLRMPLMTITPVDLE
jgi:hypothetical protein